MRCKRITIFFFLSLLLATVACVGVRQVYPGEMAGSAEGSAQNVDFDFQIRATSEVGQAPPDLKAATAPLPAAQAQKLWAGVDPLPSEKVSADFKLPAQTRPAPRGAQEIKESFPPAASLAPPAPPTLDPQAPPTTVERCSPEGEIEQAQVITLTFSQPMVPLNSIGVTSQTAPATIKPEVAGSWRWLGVKTALFQPQDGRLPMATELHVQLKPELRDLAGRPLAKDSHFTIRTAPVRIVAAAPQGSGVGPTPLAYALFNQPVDPQIILKSLKIAPRLGKDKYGSGVALELVPQEQVSERAEIRVVVKERPSNYWVAFRPQAPLKADTDYSLLLEAGAKGAEGSLKTTQPQAFDFKTFERLHLVATNSAGWRKDGLSPALDWRLTFNNRLDAKALAPAQILQVEPKLEEMAIRYRGQSLFVSGRRQPNTTYKVTINPQLRDVYAQHLGANPGATFKVGPLSPILIAPGSELSLLDPASPHTYSVYSASLSSFKAKLFAVSPSDYQRSLEEPALMNFRSMREFKGLGRQVWERQIKVEGPLEEVVETPIDLSEALKGGRGLALLILEAPVPGRSGNFIFYRWLQSTPWAVDAWADGRRLLVAVNRLEDGQPVAGAKLEWNGRQAETDGQGRASWSWPTTLGKVESKPQERLLIVNDGASQMVASLPGALYLRRQAGQRQLLWQMAADRGVYQPGEEVHLQGWLRSVGYGPQAQPQIMASQKLKWQLRDARGAEIASGQIATTPLGSFQLQFPLPADTNLGSAQLSFEALDLGRDYKEARRHYYHLEIQEFRRPEFEVQTQMLTSTHLQGEEAQIAAQAQYYAGGALAASPITWRVQATKTRYAPPGWDGFSFGEWNPWWGWWRRDSHSLTSRQLESQTDAKGQSRVLLELGHSAQPYPVRLEASAAISDLNRQTWSSSTSFVVHPARYYVGLKLERNFYPKAAKPQVELILTDLDGQAVAGQPIQISLERYEETYDEEGQLEERILERREQKVTSASKPVKIQLALSEAGQWRLKARVRDPQGRENESLARLWVGMVGRGEWRNPQLKVEDLALIPDREEYLPGQTAQILVQAPWKEGYGTYILSRQGIAQRGEFRLQDGCATLELPLRREWAPNINLQVAVNGRAPRQGQEDKLQRPACAQAELSLPISLQERELQVEVKPAQRQLNPGAKSQIEVRVRTSAGEPVSGAEVALWVVDEAIWALTNYQVESPLANFYPQREAGAVQELQRAQLLLANEKDLIGEAQEEAGAVYATSARMEAASDGLLMMRSNSMAPQAMAKSVAADSAAAPSANNAALALRQDFNPLALWVGKLATDAQGVGRAPFKLPDNLTRYRVVAIAGDRLSRFGKGESTLTARLPLMVRPSFPRFLNFGDSASLSLLLQNQTDRPLQVQVAARASNLTLEESAYALELPAQSRREVAFPARTVEAGQAVVQVVARTQAQQGQNSYGDSAQVALPVYTPATTEAFATYGTLAGEETIAQLVGRPPATFPQFGALDISTSSTALQELTEAVLYLCSYPYEGSEQVASRLIVLANLQPILAKFKGSDLPSAEEVAERIKSDLKTLESRQNTDGSFGYWTRHSPQLPLVSIHCAQALVSLRQEGHKVPDRLYNRALTYARQVERDLKEYSPWARWSVLAYADNVLWQAQASGTERYKKLATERLNEAPLEVLAWYWPVVAEAGDKDLAAELRRQIFNRVGETAGKASLGDYSWDDQTLILSSTPRAQAVALRSLLALEPQHTLAPKLVRDLLEGRRQGHWMTTQANAMAVLALRAYWEEYEEVEPQFVVDFWLGKDYVGRHQFEGRQTAYHHSAIPLKELPTQSQLLLRKEGPGRLYYRLGLKYALKDLTPPPLEAGFSVERAFRGADDPQDVVQVGPGEWRFKLGARIECTTTLVAPSRRAHVALEVPIPAGTEILNGALRLTEELPSKPQQKVDWWSWRPNPFQHENLRHQQAEAYAWRLAAGSYQYVFYLRATAPGEYVLPPAKAQEMYAPETLGRSAGAKVIIE